MGKGRRGKLLVWFACPAGAGSGTIIKLEAQDVIDAHGLTNKVELDAIACNVVTDLSCDIVVCTMNLVEMFKKMVTIPIVGIMNVMSAKEYEEKLLPVIYESLEKEEKNEKK
ncbi:MAG TPA: hypothetical protein G4N92_06495 [Anaerolineae bacterium]|nr:hypothetical protein [Anaerolineae bacterium]